MKKLLSLICAFIILFSLTTSTYAETDETGISLSFSTATDEELYEAIDAIKAELRSRIKTSIALDMQETSIVKGKAIKLSAKVLDIPDGIKAGKISWNTSDSSVASCQNGSVKGVGNGDAVITASCILSDGTEISSDCLVKVYTPVTGLKIGTKKFKIGIGEEVPSGIEIQPKDASNTELNYSSDDPTIASVSQDGTISGKGFGTTTIRATSTDGSEKNISYEVSVVAKDDVGVTKVGNSGAKVTVSGYSESKGSRFAKPSDGNVFLLIDVLIENETPEEISISSMLSLTGYCDGYTCDYSFSATLSGSGQMDGTIAPGKKMKGQAAFEVPKDWKEFELNINLDYWRSDIVKFTVYHQ